MVIAVMTPTRIPKIPGRFYTTVIFLFIFLINSGHCQDVGSFLAGLLGSSEIPGNESSPNYPPCPGECMHLLTSLLCSRVIDELNCGASYLRCCVAADFNFGTVVETSAPLPEDLNPSSDPPEDYGIFEDGLHPNVPPPSTTVAPATEATTHVHKFIIPMHRPNHDQNPSQEKKPCPGMCVENAFARYCSSFISYGVCEEGSICCSSSSADATEEPKISPTTAKNEEISVQQYVKVSSTRLPQVTTKVQTTSPTESTTEATISTTTVAATTTPAGPPCPGSCVAPLFSLLCDSVVMEYHCPNEGRCCISEEDLKPTTTTTTEPPIPTCPGACIPAFLSGMCNKPSELIIRTDCEANFICCHEPLNKDGESVNPPHRPFLRPPPQGMFSSHPQPPSHMGINPPLRRPPLQNHYPPPQHIPIPRPPSSSAAVSAPHNHPPSATHTSPFIVIGGQGSPSRPQSNLHQGNFPYNPSRPINRPHILFHQENPTDSSALQNQNLNLPSEDPSSRPLGPQYPKSPSSSSESSSQAKPSKPSIVSSSVSSQETFKIVHSHPSQSEGSQSHSTLLPGHEVYHGSVSVPQSYPHSPSHGSVLDSHSHLSSVAQSLPSNTQLRPNSSPQGPLQISQPHSNLISMQQSRPLPPKLQIPPEISVSSEIRPVQPHVPHSKPEMPQDSQSRPPSSSRPILSSQEPQPHQYEHHGQRYKPRKPQQTISSQNSSSYPQVSPGTEDHRPDSDGHQQPFIPISSVVKPAVPQPPHRQPGDMKPQKPSVLHHPTPQNSADKNRPFAVKPLVFSSDASKESPLCPGPCIASFLRFTCFGQNAVYNGFSCTKSGTMCCAPVEDIEKYEETLKIQDSFFDSRPDIATTAKPVPSSDHPRPDPSMCGLKGSRRRETPRIVGGRTSTPGEWCWQVALINAKNQYLCGGALIGSRWVLSAAHCITALVRDGDPIYVRVGDFDLASQFGTPGAQTQRVSTSYIHHNHNGQTLDNDIVLLRLENPADLNDNVCLVCLPARGALSQPGKRCTVTGYGYQWESGPVALKIREAQVPIVDDMKCVEQVNNVTEKLFILPTGSFCAGGEAGHDACQGDGGGPLVCQNEGFYELMGLVSWGFGCGKENVPGVYVKVSSFIGWINQIISVNN